MKAPDKIYAEMDYRTGFVGGFAEPTKSDDIEYIRKDTLLEWAEDCIAEIRRSPNFNTDLATKCTMYAVFKDKLNSM